LFAIWPESGELKRGYLADLRNATGSGGRLRAWRAIHHSSLNLRDPISAHMTRDPETLRPDASVAFALNNMIIEAFQHIELVDEILKFGASCAHGDLLRSRAIRRAPRNGASFAMESKQWSTERTGWRSRGCFNRRSRYETCDLQSVRLDGRLRVILQVLPFPEPSSNARGGSWSCAITAVESDRSRRLVSIRKRIGRVHGVNIARIRSSE
jgi:CBS domain-containing protein